MNPTVPFAGRIGRDPELRINPNTNQSVVSFEIAVEKRRKGDDGAWSTVATTWPRFVAFGRLADNIVETLGKGDAVVIIATADAQQWEDRETGDKRSRLDWVVQAIGPDLRWATATVTRNQRDDTSRGPGRDDEYDPDTEPF